MSRPIGLSSNKPAQYFEAFNTVMRSWWSASLGNVRVLLICFAGIAFSSLETWLVRELKVVSGKPKRKHRSKRISQEQEENENSKKSRQFKQMPPRRAPVFLLSPGINTRRTTLPPCWIYSMSRGLVSTNQTFFASELLLFPTRYAHVRYSSRMIDRFLNWGDHGKPKGGKIKGRCQPPSPPPWSKQTQYQTFTIPNSACHVFNDEF